MYEIIYYQDKNGNEPIKEYLDELWKNQNNKDSRIRFKKINEYIKNLSRYGTTLGEPMVKHITGTNLWELRPSNNRIFFVYFQNNTFILLHHFIKDTNKTPRREIEKAENNLKDFIGRVEYNEPNN